MHRALLQRRAAVYLPAAAVRPEPVSPAALTALDVVVLDRGYLLAPELRAAFAALDDATLLAAASTLLSDVEELLGVGRQHTPLFRSFPDGIPTDTGDDVTSTS